MKRILLVATLFVSLCSFAAPTAEINERILKAFNETFLNAKEITWHENRDNYQANFKIGEIHMRAMYAEDGTLIKTIRYYGESVLPAHIVAKLKKKYAGKEIFAITETFANDEMNYDISLKDDDNWYMVKSDAYGNLSQRTKFKRAD